MNRTFISTMLLFCYWILAIIPAAVTCILYPLMPDVVVVHFGVGGTADRWAGKWELFLMPAAILALAVFMLYAVKKAASNSSKPNSAWSATLLLLSIVLLILNIVTIWVISANVSIVQTLTTGIDFLKLIYICLGALIALIGAFAPLIGNRSSFNSRVPWTLTESSWMSLHAFSRKVLIIGGVVVVCLCGVLLPSVAATLCLFAVMATSSASIMLYSWILRSTD